MTDARTRWDELPDDVRDALSFMCENLVVVDRLLSSELSQASRAALETVRKVKGRVKGLMWNGDGKVTKPESPRPMKPPIPEGARYQHDRWNCEFLGQYDDADLYVEMQESIEEGDEWNKKGYPIGRYGSCFVMRVCNARFLGVHEMLHTMHVCRAAKVSFEDDPYMYQAYRIAKERGWIKEPDSPSRVACVFIPKGKK